MAVDFETPTEALFQRLIAVSGVNYSTRKLESWDDTPPAVTPSLMLTSGPIDVFEPTSNLPGISPPMYKAKLTLVLYCQLDESEGVAPSTALNNILSAVCNAILGETVSVPAGRPFPSPPGMRGTTLGGLCAYCRVAGTIERFEGLIGKFSAASIPLEMVLTT